MNASSSSSAQASEVVRTDLADGVAPEAAEALLVVDPASLEETEVFAMDQFLMRGGTVLLSLGAFESAIGPSNLSVTERTTGLEDWLAHFGVEIGKSLVMDPRNSAFPVPVTRNIGGFSFQELQMLDYPYFVEVREDGLNTDSPMVSQIPQISMPWVSPLSLDAEAHAERTVTELLASSPDAWLSASTNVTPRFSDGAVSPFQPEGERGRQLLGAVIKGRFNSFFAGQESPLLRAALEAQASEDQDEALDAGDAMGENSAGESAAQAGGYWRCDIGHRALPGVGASDHICLERVSVGSQPANIGFCLRHDLSGFPGTGAERHRVVTRRCRAGEHSLARELQSHPAAINARCTDGIRVYELRLRSPWAGARVRVFACCEEAQANALFELALAGGTVMIPLTRKTLGVLLGVLVLQGLLAVVLLMPREQSTEPFLTFDVAGIDRILVSGESSNEESEGELPTIDLTRTRTRRRIECIGREWVRRCRCLGDVWQSAGRFRAR